MAGPLDRRTVTEIFRVEARKRPGKAAVIVGEEAFTYAELDRRSNRLAHVLRERGVRTETTVGFLLEPGLEAIVTLLAILKAGGAYLPLATDWPRERLRLVVQDAGPVLVVTTSGREATLPAGTGRICLDKSGAELAASPDDDPVCRTSPENLAYVIYTSGSTGRPKGVAICHRGVVRLVRDCDYVDLDQDVVALLLAPLAFDASTFELWAPLLNGGTLAVSSHGLLDPVQLVADVARHRVTTLLLPSGLFNQLTDPDLAALTGLRHLLVGGDVISASRFARAAALPGLRVINAYGPTENTTLTCCFTAPAAWQSDRVPIGRPVSGTRVQVLDELLSPLPAGRWGELHTSGEGLARGYFADPALTADRFRPDPTGAPGERTYRVGDIVRELPDGLLEFQGRLDAQVKLRGYRVDLGEIEVVLESHPAVRQAAVVVRNDEVAGRHLVAYVVATSPHHREGMTERLGRHLADILPAYMAELEYHLLDRLPLTSRGKLDRQALASLNGMPPAVGAGGSPTSETELELTRLWSEVLRANGFGIDDEFFAVGGDSLQAIRLMGLIRETFGVAIPLTLRLARGMLTLRTMARAIEKEVSRAGQPDLG